MSHKMTWCKPMSKSHGLATARVYACALCKHVMISHLSIIHALQEFKGSFNVSGVAILHVGFLLIIGWVTSVACLPLLQA